MDEQKTTETVADMQKEKIGALQIPTQFEAQQLHASLSVKELVDRLHFATQGAVLPTRRGRDLFSVEEPNTGLEVLFEACILPPTATLREMLKEFGQLWGEGKARSIIDWTDRSIRYPVAALAVYVEVDRANEIRVEWRRASDWLNKWADRTERLASLAMQIRRLMATYEWDTYLRANGTSIHTKNLFSLLSDRFLSDNHVDAMLQVLMERLELTGGHCDVVLAPCIFQQLLEQAFASRHEQNLCMDRLLGRYQQEALSGRTRKLYLVGHIHSMQHWVAWRIDYRCGTLSHGDSFGLSEHVLQPVKDCLMWWMSTIYQEKRDCTYLGNNILHGDQTRGDSFSCGVIAYNAIAHDLFGDEIWTMENRRYLRARAFVDVVLHHNERRTEITSTIPMNSSICTDDEPEIVEIRAEQTKTSFTNSTSNVLPVEAEVKVQLDHDWYTGTPDVEVAAGDNETTALKTYENLEELGYDDDSESKYVSGPPMSSTPSRSSSRMSLIHCDDDNETSFTKNSDKELPSEESYEEMEGTSKREGEPDIAARRPVKKLKAANLGPLDLFFQPKEDMMNKQSGSKDERESRSDDYCDGNRGVERVELGRTDVCRDLVVGVSRSAQHARKMRESRLAGTQIINTSFFNTFRNHVLTIDPNAEFDAAGWRVKHSRCRKWLQMKSAYSAVYLELHIQRCKASNKTLDGFGFVDPVFKSGSKPRHQDLSYETLPCSGLTASYDVRIEMYMRRPTALGGGGKGKVELARKKYGQRYADLKKAQKMEVDRLHETTWTWVIKHDRNAVFSTSCKQHVKVPDSYAIRDKTDHACTPCLELFHSKRFRNAIRIPEPPAANTKYANKSYHQERLGLRLAKVKGIEELLNPKDGSSRSALLYARGVANGAFKEHAVSTQLVDAMLKKLEREAKGKKMTNFKYPPAFDEFITTVFMVSPRAHSLLREYFPVRSDRSIRDIRSRDSPFMAGICSRTFEIADKFVTALNVPQRHVALSADDTKLFATFRPFLDKETEQWYIVGGVGEPHLVGDPEQLRSELQKAKLMKATKVRIWVLMIPVPKVPPIVLAAMAITDDITASELSQYTLQILEGLHTKNIWTVSYACDGTEKERANQKIVREQAHGKAQQVVRAPCADVDEIKVDIALFHGKPLAMLQDSLHARKTYRNNLQTGTKTMVLGNYCALYRDLWEMSQDPCSPIFGRDVEKTDKQDDRAAARVFSSASLAWLYNNHPESLRTIIYLFIFGELIDAYQNRSITHSERIRMVFRAHYFIELWKNFIRRSNYRLNKTCLSREALDISTFLIKGFLELFYIYRDWLPGVVVPLLPWLHSSEGCEHIFGELRKQVKDFDFAVFLHLMPKIHWLVRRAMNLGSISIADAKQRAHGYAHTWANTEGLSVSNLTMFPTDEELFKLAKLAFDDAEDIWDQLGISIQDLRINDKPSEPVFSATRNAKDGDAKHQRSFSTPRHRSAGIQPVADGSDSSSSESEGYDEPAMFPSIADWYPDDESRNALLHSAHDIETEEYTSLGIEDSTRAVLEDLFMQEQERAENGSVRLDSVDNAMLNISCAKLFLDFDESLHVDSIHAPTKEEYEKFLAEYASSVGKTLADGLPSILDAGPGVRGHIGTSPLTFTKEKAIQIRCAHETELEKKAIRTANRNPKPTPINADTDESKARHLLIKKINEVLKLDQEQGTGTGLERRTRWMDKGISGNTANAALATENRAKAALSRRYEIYSNFSIPRFASHRLSNAGIQSSYPLSEGMYVFTYCEKRILLGQVLSLYSKGGGTHGKHCWVKSVTNISQLSYISLQVFEQQRGRVFRELLTSMSHLRARCFTHILPFELLCALPDRPLERNNKAVVELSDVSFKIWLEFQSFSNVFPAVMKEFRRRN